ncbi:hypothetical protein [Streptomyces sp. NPDC058457]|uniref:hypothetical protein n=1 Tax=Streptomyces sp. NPDC058457 TaxID=3346507 RepID=UPI00364FAAD5
MNVDLGRRRHQAPLGMGMHFDAPTARHLVVSKIINGDSRMASNEPVLNLALTRCFKCRSETAQVMKRTSPPTIPAAQSPT